MFHQYIVDSPPSQILEYWGNMLSSTQIGHNPGAEVDCSLDTLIFLGRTAFPHANAAAHVRKDESFDEHSLSVPRHPVTHPSQAHQDHVASLDNYRYVFLPC